MPLSVWNYYFICTWQYGKTSERTEEEVVISLHSWRTKKVRHLKVLLHQELPLVAVAAYVGEGERVP